VDSTKLVFFYRIETETARPSEAEWKDKREDADDFTPCLWTVHDDYDDEGEKHDPAVEEKKDNSCPSCHVPNTSVQTPALKERAAK
jgi:hypothetical protein